MLTMLLYVLIVGLVAALLFLVASAVFGRAEELGPLPEGTTETVLPAHDISAADVRELRFQQVFRGYKAGEVDWALTRLAARIDELETQLAQAHGESTPTRTSDPGEHTGPGAIPGAWTGTQPAAPATGVPEPLGDSRIERPGDTSSPSQNSSHQDDTGQTGGMQSSLAGLTVGYAPSLPTGTPATPIGQIPWPSPSVSTPLTGSTTPSGPFAAPSAPDAGASPPSGPFTAPGTAGGSPQQNGPFTTPNTSASPPPSGPFAPTAESGPGSPQPNGQIVSGESPQRKSTLTTPAAPGVFAASPPPGGPFTAGPGGDARAPQPGDPGTPELDTSGGSPQQSSSHTVPSAPDAVAGPPSGPFAPPVPGTPDGVVPPSGPFASAAGASPEQGGGAAPIAPSPYAAGQPVADQSSGFAPPSAGNPAHPPVTTTQGQPPYGQAGAPGVWPGQAGQNAQGQL